MLILVRLVPTKLDEMLSSYIAQLSILHHLIDFTSNAWKGPDRGCLSTGEGRVDIYNSKQ